MAASVDIDLDVKQGLLELRSEEERLRLLARLFKDGIKRLELAREDRRPRAGERQSQVPAKRSYSTTTARRRGAGRRRRSALPVSGSRFTAWAPPKYRFEPFHRTSR